MVIELTISTAITIALTIFEKYILTSKITAPFRKRQIKNILKKYQTIFPDTKEDVEKLVDKLVVLAYFATNNSDTLTRQYAEDLKKNMNEMDYSKLCDCANEVYKVLTKIESNKVRERANEVAQIWHNRSDFAKFIDGQNLFSQGILKVKSEFYFANVNVFTGRDNEIKKLEEFCDHNEQFRWWCVTGRAAVGKSKLLHNFVKSNEKLDWEMKFIKIDPGLPSFSDCFYEKNLFLVIDYYGEVSNEVIRFLKMLCYKLKTKKIRVVLIERETINSEYIKRFDRSLKDFLHEDSLVLKEFDAEGAKILVEQWLRVRYNIDNEKVIENIKKSVDKQLKNHNEYRPLFVIILIEFLLSENIDINEEDCLYSALDRIICEYNEAVSAVACYTDNLAYQIKEYVVKATIENGTCVSSDDGRNEEKFINKLVTAHGSLEKTNSALCQIEAVASSTTKVQFYPIEPDFIGQLYVFLALNDFRNMHTKGGQLWQNEVVWKAFRTKRDRFFSFTNRCVDDSAVIKKYFNKYHRGIIAEELFTLYNTDINMLYEEIVATMNYFLSHEVFTNKQKVNSFNIMKHSISEALKNEHNWDLITIKRSSIPAVDTSIMMREKLERLREQIDRAIDKHK
ncbi:MAG: hypothetical protein FWD44_00020 [Oscillospiraceae bacterium]|nr:hypothetical protein [Oscillospiraceae bacterium]